MAALCRASGLNRGTFYLHYADIASLAEDVARHLVEGVTENLRQMDVDGAEEFAEQSKDLLVAYLLHVAEHRVFYRWLLGSTGNWRTVRSLMDDYSAAIRVGLGNADPAAVASPDASEELSMTTSLLGGALFGVVVRWVDEPPQWSAEDAAEWLLRELTLHPAPRHGL